MASYSYNGPKLAPAGEDGVQAETAAESDGQAHFDLVESRPKSIDKYFYPADFGGATPTAVSDHAAKAARHTRHSRWGSGDALRAYNGDANDGYRFPI